MTDALFSTLEVDLGAGVRPGYRLHRLELLNWGTFDGRCEVLRLAGDNTLVTGDIGSGKSTLVDAVTTLLLPANRISYNKAAGAETRERSLRTYVLGHYKSERVESTGASRAVGLRDQSSYSVILGVFRNEGYGQDVTLAQVFWMPGTSESQPRRFFVTAEDDLSIAADFTEFGTDPADLKRRLRSRGASVHDHYPDYGTRLRRLLGIRSEQALELFHQTISMKSVGNLTDFVRHHMLEPAAAATRISALVQHFEDLTRAHDAVRKARDQLEQLEPIVAACDDFDARGQAMAQARQALDALPLWAAEHRLRVLAAEQDRVEQARRDLDDALALAQRRQDELSDEHAGLVRAREGIAGGRLGAIEVELAGAALRREECRGRADQLNHHLGALDLPLVDDESSFEHALLAARARDEALIAERESDHQRRTDASIAVRDAERESATLQGEIASLRGRASNIDSSSLQVRDRLAGALGVEAAHLPFVGELVQVRADEGEWRGAAERVLRGFALSVLVPSELYAAASRWVDENHLGARFVYYRVGDVVNRRPSAAGDAPTLAQVLEVKDGPHAAWLADELRSRADHVRVHHVDELREHRKAVTRLGQVKTDRRHEKDDRFALEDRTRWVLGWSNADKVDALIERGATVQARLSAARDALVAAKAGADQRDTEAATVRQVLAVTAWSSVDWRSSAHRIDELQRERDVLQRGNAEVEALHRRLAEVENARAAQVAVVTELTEEVGALKGEHRRNAEQQRLAQADLDAVATDRLDELRTAYGLLESRHDVPETLDGCAVAERDLQRDLSAAIQAHQDKQSMARERAAKRIAAFRQAWPSDTTELGADVLAGAEYRALRDRITGDDLPRFEAEFKRQLNTNTINDIAGFQAWLDQSAQTIRSRIDTINESLSAIDYSPGTRIRLLTEPSTNQEVRAFRDDLRACTDDALSTDDQYSEERFRRVKAIIERFRGREGLTEVDKRWTELVTDVRSWFVFAASEREADSGVEREHYTDSDGKSGGQKEKLAYTILAASLAYQFGLEWGVPKSKDFRFAVIDEAFGRGSDASTRYALDLFAKLGLQLLVVTPLQKVHVIEPYVSAVGFVENRSGQRSRLQTLTIEEYHAERAEHARAGRES
jgi:uncharacterized protein YPO0396